jgi:DNA replication protein DnaC
MYETGLDQFDIEILKELLLRSKLTAARQRSALCIDLGLNLQELPISEDVHGSAFATELINHLKNTENKQSICKLCQRLERVFRQQSDRDRLVAIQQKLNCQQQSSLSLLETVKRYLNANSLYQKISDPRERYLIPLDFSQPDLNLSDNDPNQEQSLGNKIFTRFDGMGENRTLIILGKPGAGKTAILLALACELISRTNTNGVAQIPVLLNLSLWNNNQQIQEWVAEQLEILYNYSISLKKIKKLFRETELVLLLDGFDEIESENRNNFLVKLHHFSSQYPNIKIVLSSRNNENNESQSFGQEIESSSIKLELKPLDPRMINRHYQNGLPERLNDLISSNNTSIEEIINNPLFFGIIVNLGQEFTVDEEKRFIETLRNNNKLENKILSTYIDLIIKNYLKEQYPQTREWLNWLAKQMKKEKKTIFLIENIQPNWLYQEKDQKIAYCYYLGVALIVGLLCGLCSGLLSDLLNYNQYSSINYVYWGTISGIPAGLASGAIFLLFKYWKYNLTDNKLIALIIGTISALIRWIINSLLTTPKVQLLDIIIFALFLGYIFYRLELEQIQPVHSIDFQMKSKEKFKIHFRVGMIWALFFGQCMLIIPMLCSSIKIINNSTLNNFIIKAIIKPLLSNSWIDNFIETTIKPVININTSLSNISINDNSVLWGFILLVVFIGLNGVVLFGYASRRLIIPVILGVLISLAIVSVFLQITEYIRWSFAQFSTVLLGLLALEVFVGLKVAIILGFDKREGVENTAKRPNYGIKKTFNNSIKLLLICGLISGLISAIFWIFYFLNKKIIWWIFYRGETPDGWFYFGLIVGAIVGLLSAMVNGETSGLVWIKHYVLRIILWLKGYTPCPGKYADFLNDAAAASRDNDKPVLLQKFGGGYQFKHQEFLNYFAALNNNEDATNDSSVSGRND